MALTCVAAGAVLGGVGAFWLMLPGRPTHLPPPGDAPVYVALGAGMLGIPVGAVMGALVGLILGLYVNRGLRDDQG